MSNDIKAILYSSSISVLLGIFGVILTYKHRFSEIRIKESYVIVTFSWIIMGIIGALPFYFGNCLPTFLDAFFESVSGFTTTGASVITDVEVIPKGILFWRSLTHWIGGMGIIVMMIAILPALKKGSINLYSAETSSISKEKIHARVINVAKRLWFIYFAMTVILVLLLMLGKMNFYESLCHAFGAIGTGGYSTRNLSIGAYSPYIQYVIIIFMFLSGINFSLHYFALKGKLRKVLYNEELILYSSIIVVSTLLISIGLYLSQNNNNLEEVFRKALFQVVSIITSTGYATDDYLKWPTFCWLIILALMFVGGCAGSTSGGIKVIRHLMFYKYVFASIKKMLYPKGAIVIKYNGELIDEKIATNSLIFILLYILIAVISTVLLIISGIDSQTSFGAVLTSMGGIGPGIGTVGPASNFAHLHHFAKILLPFLMIAGRLELYTFFVIFLPSFWKV
jgi:trk system potassium uptake protein TrkH